MSGKNPKIAYWASPVRHRVTADTDSTDRQWRPGTKVARKIIGALLQYTITKRERYGPAMDAFKLG
jgi:hypothetical protein